MAVLPMAERMLCLEFFRELSIERDCLHYKMRYKFSELNLFPTDEIPVGFSCWKYEEDSHKGAKTQRFTKLSRPEISLRFVAITTMFVMWITPVINLDIF